MSYTADPSLTGGGGGGCVQCACARGTAPHRRGRGTPLPPQEHMPAGPHSSNCSARLRGGDCPLGSSQTEARARRCCRSGSFFSVQHLRPRRTSRQKHSLRRGEGGVQREGRGGGGGWHKASASDCLPLAAPIGLSPLLILTLCGSERVLVVSTEPPDDLSCLTTPGVGRPGDGLLPVPLTRGIQTHPPSPCGGLPTPAPTCVVTCLGGGGGGHEALVSDCVPLAAPIGLSPLLILTLCGSERVLVVSTEPPDDLSCLTTPGVGRPGDGLLPVPLTRGIQTHPPSPCGGLPTPAPTCVVTCLGGGGGARGLGI